MRKKPLGFRFRRQHPFNNYILDFYCHSLNLGIEVDGKIHEQEEVRKNDEEREASLKRQGLHIIRFTNRQVILELTIVIQTIEQHLQQSNNPANEK